MAVLRAEQGLHLPERFASVVALLLKPFILVDLTQSLEITCRAS